jgi:hypothetical protein
VATSPFKGKHLFTNSPGNEKMIYTQKNWKPEVKHPDAAPPNGINVFALPVYVPPKNDPVRPGADDHLKIQSKG